MPGLEMASSTSTGMQVVDHQVWELPISIFGNNLLVIKTL
jgi:hypothetical protein